ncbi:MAG TPA: bifunctional phosphopantothenoylcysteine decarboxylase/phosphopantothenate--cysteine ligase CoaBC [Alphaproteobacteria bacterium]|nr:bifunctional phosphopantothenoylcysteine decarboxylase/phosphopantothenate--cysteine ligase CoaBC [Alphaproteobacteria bacterium]
MLAGKNVLLIVAGGIAAYKCLEAARGLKALGASAPAILTRGGARFVTPMSLTALSGDRVYEDLFSLTDENEMGHIRLARDADLVLVAPATANILARMAHGIADDLATTVLLATRAPVMVAPAMNRRMWEHAATQANVNILKGRGIHFLGPVEGKMACGEEGMGRMVEARHIVAAVENFFRVHAKGGLCGRRALVTSGPTHEPIDPVRYIANRSSGKQGHAIARAMADEGAETVLVTGPTNEPDPAGMKVVHVKTAVQMLAACDKAMEKPFDVAVAAAAVTDWQPEIPASRKIRKRPADGPPEIALVANPDILKAIAGAANRRPGLVIGFAAETENLEENAASKLKAKGCDWIVANDVSKGTGVFGGDDNTVRLLTGDGVEVWPKMTKEEVAARLVERIVGALGAKAAVKSS